MKTFSGKKSGPLQRPLRLLFITSIFVSTISGCPRNAHDLARIEETLILPPGQGARNHIQTMAHHESCVQTALLRLHYLVDLFDFARFMPHEPSRTVLLETLNIPSRSDDSVERTAAVTKIVLQTLHQYAARLLNHSKKSGINSDIVEELSFLKKMLDLDREFPRTANERLEHVNFLKTHGDGPGRFRANALLRLYGWCAQSLWAMMIAPEGKRQKAANFCLYTLTEHDPRAYVSENVHLLPAPDPLALHAMNRITLDKIAAESENRLASSLVPVLKKRWKQEHEMLAKTTSLWTSALKSKKDLVVVEHCSPRFESPLVLVEEERIRAGDRVVTRPSDRNLRPLLTWLYGRSERKHMSLRVSPSIPWYRVWAVLQASVRSGFESIGFQVLAPIPKKKAHTAPQLCETILTESATGLRMSELPLSMLAIAPWPTEKEKSFVPAVQWREDCTSRWITLEISPRRLRVSARGGACSPTINIDRIEETGERYEKQSGLSAAIAELQDLLLDVKRTFPDECGLLVTVTGTTPFHLLARVLSAARKTPDGRPLFESQALRINPGPCNEDIPFPDGIDFQPSPPD